MKYKYPTLEEINRSGEVENIAVKMVTSAMHEAIEDTPLPDLLKVYALIDLAFQYGDEDYIQDVLHDIAARRHWLGLGPGHFDETAHRPQTELIDKLRYQVNVLLEHCPDPECRTCSKIACPHERELHYQHDGCPKCDGNGDEE